MIKTDVNQLHNILLLIPNCVLFTSKDNFRQNNLRPSQDFRKDAIICIRNKRRQYNASPVSHKPKANFSQPGLPCLKLSVLPAGIVKFMESQSPLNPVIITS